jgi:hypothetical protein
MCAGNSYSLDGGACVCQVDTPTLCNYDGGEAPQCVDTTIDTGNCGGCGMPCKIKAACNSSTCGAEPSQLVAAAPGCMSMRVVFDSGNIYWADMGHGTISSIAAAGGSTAITTIAGPGLHIAAVQTPNGPLSWPTGPLETALLVHDGTVYWVGSSSTVSCTAPGTCSGGVGTTIMSATAGTAPKTLLTMANDPGPSPVSASASPGAIEALGQNPAILAIALSPDAKTIYFAAGTRFYSVPTSGTGVVTYVGYAEGPEHGEATAIATDGTYLYYPTNVSGNIEILTIGMMCNADAAANEMCPARISESQGDLVYDTITIKGTNLYWGNESTVHVGDVTTALGGSLSGGDYPSALKESSLTGFVVGTANAYFGEPGSDSVCSQDPATPCALVPMDGGPTYECLETTPANQTCVTLGYIEKGAAPPFDGSGPPAVVIARDQPNAMSFALDGTNVYWTTSNCDINYIADMPQ